MVRKKNNAPASEVKTEAPTMLVEIYEFVDENDKVVGAGEVRTMPNFLIKYVGKVRRMAKEDILEGGEVKVKAGDYFMDVPEDDEIPTVLINGRKRIELPSGAEQKAGFNHPDAVFLLNNYRDTFKKVVTKDGLPVAEGGQGDNFNAADAENASTEAQGEGNEAEGVNKDAK